MAPHVVVIGAGVIGASVAFHLAEADARVTLIDRQGVAAMASGKSFGWVNASFFANADHFRLRRAAMQAHRRLQARTGADLVDWSGALWWEEQGDGFARQEQTLKDLDYPARALTPGEFADLAPAIATPPQQCLLVPDEGAIDAAKWAATLVERACGAGARIWAGAEVQGIATQGGRISGVRTLQGTIPADHVVVAAGTATSALLAPLDVHVPMLKRPGVMARTGPVAPVLNHIMVSPTLEFRQDSTGRILAPTVAGHQGDEAEQVEGQLSDAADRALDILRTQLPGLDLQWEQVTLADRPMPGDGLPVVGATALPGLYVATMHSGATLAPLIGELVAQEVLQGEEAPLLRTFRPARFA